MKKILGLTIAALLVMVMVGSGSWAWFSDTESSPDNSLSAGTLDLKIDGDDLPVTTFSMTDVAPGDSGSGNVTLTNDGASSIDGELDVQSSAIINTGGTTGEYGDSTGDLGAAAEIAIYLDVDQSGTFTNGDIGLDNADNTTYNFAAGLQWHTIDSYGSIIWDNVETMSPSASDDFVALWRVPDSTGNNIQGDTVSCNITFILQQPAAD